MTLSAPNNPVDARGKASKRAESGPMQVQHRLGEEKSFASCSGLHQQCSVFLKSAARFQAA